MFSPLLLLLAITVYPFQPQRMLSIVVSAAIVLAALGLASWVFIQIDRDPVCCSRISRTTPNVASFDLSLATKLLPMLVPIIGLILATFPDASFWLPWFVWTRSDRLSSNRRGVSIANRGALPSRRGMVRS